MLTLLRCIDLSFRLTPSAVSGELPLSQRVRSSVRPMAKSETPITIKKYANRRLYNTGTSTYVTLEDLAPWSRKVKTSSSMTPRPATTSPVRSSRRSSSSRRTRPGKTCCPTTFLRQLIRFYGDSMQMVVPKYLEASIDSLTREQEKFRKQMTSAFGTGPPFAPLEEQVRRNMELFERTFSMFKPFGWPRCARIRRRPSRRRQ